MKFDTKHYVPILKAKQGEFRALQETDPNTKDLMTPLFEIISVTWDYEEDEEAKSIDEHLNNVGQKISDCWGAERLFFLDSNFIAGDRLMSDGATHHLSFLFNDFRAKGLNAVPVTSLAKQDTYKLAVKDIITVDNRGICFKIQNTDFANTNLKALIDTELAFYGIAPSDVDLLFDLGSIDSNIVSLLSLSVPTLINNTIPYLDEWRTFTLSASAFPVNLSAISGNTTARIERTEWLFWQSLMAMGLKRFPSFGDYSIAHPDLVDLDPRIMTISASIRYTADEYWVVVKGRSTKRSGYEQFHNLCQQLVALPEFSGAAFSWGDNYIEECAGRSVKSGNTTTWRIVGNNHHFQKVISQISS